MHDAHAGAISSVKLDAHEKFVLSSGNDGLLYVH